MASGLVLFVSITAAAAFIACGTPKPATQPPQGPSGPFIEMLSVPGGSFRMGSPRGGGLLIEQPAHQVTIQDFSLSQYEVTQKQYFEITGARPSSCKTNPEKPGIDGWMSLPVEMVNWYEALVFCNKLSIKENLTPVYRINGSVNPNDWGDVPRDTITASWETVEWVQNANGYRLPTEAEWEYAARGGANSTNLKYAGDNDAENVAWFYENSKTMSHEVGRKNPNELDLYDMSGNVMEWCWNWQIAYTAEAKENPVGPTSGMYKVIRGGGWSYAVEYCLVTYRHANLPYYRGVNLGFRVARSL